MTAATMMGDAELIARVVEASARGMLHEDDIGTEVERFFEMRRSLYQERRRGARSFSEAALRATTETIEAILARPAGPVELRHHARRALDGTMEIVDRQFDFVRCRMPYDYRFTCNAQQQGEAERICRALEGPMASLGTTAVGET